MVIREGRAGTKNPPVLHIKGIEILATCDAGRGFIAASDIPLMTGDNTDNPPGSHHRDDHFRPQQPLIEAEGELKDPSAPAGVSRAKSFASLSTTRKT